MSGRTERGHESPLPAAQQQALRRATRLEWVTIAYMITCVVLVALVMGSSQAMKVAWVEDLLALVPPIAFLIAARMTRKPPSPEYPYGRHRFIASGHLAAATALLLVGGLLIADSAMSLISADRVPIGTITVLGHTFWAGWAMIAVMVYTGVGPVLIARRKLPLAERLHDRILFADADMQRADWMTAAGTILGVIGIGVGWWWADAAIAVAVALSIVRDGWTNLKYALRNLMDGRARTHNDKHTDPVVAQVQRTLEALPWAVAVRSRVRDLGHLLHVEAFIVPATAEVPVADLQAAAQQVRDLDWKVHEVVLMPVAELPSVPDPLAEPA